MTLLKDKTSSCSWIKFYGKVQRDDLLGPVFSHVNREHHLPIMYNFWSSTLLSDQSYRGNPLQKHLPLAIEANHFAQWLKLFHETVDENFAGQTAEEVESRSLSIAGIFQIPLGIYCTLVSSCKKSFGRFPGD